MDKEPTSNFDQVDQSNQSNFPQSFGQPTQPATNYGQSRLAGNQQPNLFNPQNYPYNNQTNQSNQKWSPPCQNNREQDPAKLLNQLDPKQVAELRNCTRIGFWLVTLPAVTFTYCFQRYRALKTLVPAKPGSIFFKSVFAYFGSKLIILPFCLRGMAGTLKDLNSRSANSENNQFPQPFGQFQGSPFKQQEKANEPYQQQFQSPYQQQTPKNSPYLHPQYQGQQFKDHNKEFLGESNDIGFDKEDDRNMLNKNF